MQKERNWGFISVIGIVILVMGIIATVVVVNGTKQDKEANKPLPTQYSSNSRVETATDYVSIGNPDAKVTLDIYEDLGCPFCGDLERDNKKMFTDYITGDDVKIRYHVISILDQNFNDPYSTRAANFLMAVAVHSPDQWYTIHENMYEKQPAEGGDGLANEQMMDMAKDAKAKNLDKIQQDVDDIVYSDKIGSNNEQAFKDKVQQTPTVRVNGDNIDNPDGAKIKSAVDKALG